MEIQELQVLSFIAFALVTLGVFVSDGNKFGITLLIIGIAIMSTSDGFEQDKVYTHSYTTIRNLVSASPSHTQIDGKISGNFLMFSGVIGESRVYLLREEVSKGLYKDFEVKKEVYIREDSSLKTKGKFVQHFKCYDINTYYDLYSWIFV